MPRLFEESEDWGEMTKDDFMSITKFKKCPKCNSSIPDFWRRHDLCGWVAEEPKKERPDMLEQKKNLEPNFKTAYDMASEGIRRSVSDLELARKQFAEVVARLTKRFEKLECFNVEEIDKILKRIEKLEIADKERTPEISAIIHRISLLEDFNIEVKKSEKKVNEDW